MLRSVKVGDLVFVVHQQMRRDKGPARTEWTTVKKVGRLYGYIERYGDDVPFSLETGKSHHAEDNVRNNGMGFDVYLQEETYHQEVRNRERFNELRDRLIPHGWLVKLSPEVVEKIHAALDADG